MGTNDIQSWLDQARKSGLSNDKISEQLKKSGWSDAQIAEALKQTVATKSPVSQAGSTEIPGPFEVLGQAFKSVKQHFASFLAIGAIAVIVEIILMLVISFVTVLSIAGTASLFSLSDTGSMATFIGGLGVSALIIIAMYAVFSLFFSWIQAAYLLRLFHPEYSLGDVFKNAKHYMVRLWVVSILLGLVVTGASFLLIIPGILFALWFGFSQFTAIANDSKGMQALLQSKAYVKGHWWRIFFNYLVVGIIIGIVVSLVGMLVAKSGQVVSMLFSALVTLFVIPVGLSVSYAMFVPLKQKAESTPGFTLNNLKKKGIIITTVLGWLVIPVIAVLIGMAVNKGLDTLGSLNLNYSLNDDVNLNADDSDLNVNLNTDSGTVETRNAQRKADLAKYQSALVAYRQANGSFPATTEIGTPDQINTLIAGSDTSPVVQKIVPTYLPATLESPSIAGSAYNPYYYIESRAVETDSASHFVLFTIVEQGTDAYYYYAINDAGTVWTETAQNQLPPTCDATQTPVCGYATGTPAE